MGQPPQQFTVRHGGTVDEDSVSKAFEIDLVREMILDYVLHDGRNLVISNIRTSRLVNKDWLRSTHSVLRKSQKPLFWLNLNEENFSIGKTPVQDAELCKFLSSFLGNDNQQVLIPHATVATAGFLCERNYQHFCKYLTTCGNSLIELVTDFAVDFNATPIGADIFLPTLRTFDVMLSQNMFRYTESLQNGTVQDKFDFIKTVLESSPRLKALRVKCGRYTYEDTLAPKIFGDFLLPSSLTELNIDCRLADSSLEVIASSHLPELRTLKLRANDPPFRRGLISDILRNARKTLEVFEVTDTFLMRGHNQLTTFNIPHMRKLKCLRIGTAFLELDGNQVCLQNRLPILNHLALAAQTNKTFRAWTEQSCFPTLESLCVRFSDDVQACDRPYSFDNVELYTMETIVSAFPNIQELVITFLGSDLNAFVIIMREMTTLRTLQVCVKGGFEAMHPDAWDAIFIGVSDESIAELRESTIVPNELPAESNDSIRNLADLHTLVLVSLAGRGDEQSLISDASFNYAFFKMPKLTKLSLEGRFFATEEIRERWTSEGRQLEYSDGVFARIIEAH